MRRGITPGDAGLEGKLKEMVEAGIEMGSMIKIYLTPDATFMDIRNKRSYQKGAVNSHGRTAVGYLQWAYPDCIKLSQGWDEDNDVVSESGRDNSIIIEYACIKDFRNSNRCSRPASKKLHRIRQ